MPVLGKLINPMVSHWVWEEVYYQCETGTAGLGEREETVLYPTAKFMVECVASLHSLVVSSLISWGVNEPGQTIIIQKIKKSRIFFFFFPKNKAVECSFLAKQAEGTVSCIFL